MTPNRFLPTSSEILSLIKSNVIASHAGVCIFNRRPASQTPVPNSALQDNRRQRTFYRPPRNLMDLRRRQRRIFLPGSTGGEITNYKYNHASEHGLSSNSINRIYEDSQHRLWLCSNESGIDLYRYDTDDFLNFDEARNELASDCVYDVCELSPGRLLFTTDVGFSILDCSTQKFKNYDRKNGVPLLAVNERSLYKSKQGEIFIGGIDGMVSFKEKTSIIHPKIMQSPLSASLSTAGKLP